MNQEQTETNYKVQAYERQIARASLSIDGIKLNPSDPFTWASGFRMPIYNDNRRLLNSYEHRMLVTDALVDITKSKDIAFDYIIGTSTAGIAPAASLAQKLNVPMVIMENGLPYDVRISDLNIDGDYDYNAIASTCPWSIPIGVAAANKRKLPFMYVRQSPKSHGLKQQIEGIPTEGQKVLLVDLFKDKSYAEDAEKALLEKGVIVSATIRTGLGCCHEPYAIIGRKGLIVEDLISTGGSSAGEVQAARNVGGVVNNIISIFNYGFPEAAKMFTGEVPYNKEGKKLDKPCEVDSCLWYNMLLMVAQEDNKIDGAQSALLAEWREDAFNWGANHGFPKVEKK